VASARKKPPKPRRIGILGHPSRVAVRRASARLLKALESKGYEVRLDERLVGSTKRTGHSLATLGKWCDLLVSLGGDGTALRAASALAGQSGALLAVNLGGLGFLTVAEEVELDDAVHAALEGTWPVVARRLIEAAVVRRGRRIHHGLAVNDAVLKAAGGYAAVHLRMNALGTDLGHLVADGLIAASAAGSTAYSLSAGGPILSHALEAIVVTAVCPHTLAGRSIVLASDDVLAARVLGSFDQVMLFLDGQEAFTLAPDDTVRIVLSKESVRMFQNPVKPLGRALRVKLGWLGAERRSLS
jgi:NAD+ kinase